MNNDDKETLSQLMDGEWQELDAAQSVKNACADDALKATWSRYHLIRDVIRNDSITVDTGLTSRISAAIDDEPSYSNVSAIGVAGSIDVSTSNAAVSSPANATVSGAAPQQSRHWRTGLGGVALAACVALATVIGLNIWQGAPSSGVGGQSVADLSTNRPAAGVIPNAVGLVLPEVEYVSNKGTYWVTPEAKRSAGAEKRLNALLSAHIESSPTAERTGMLPYSRLVGYDSVKPE